MTRHSVGHSSRHEPDAAEDDRKFQHRLLEHNALQGCRQVDGACGVSAVHYGGCVLRNHIASSVSEHRPSELVLFGLHHARRVEPDVLSDYEEPS